ncbi:MAG: hypothetical protein HZC28_00465 [Spirochaetes bacterium]|nr:hypothetical protein [Spirochaetota bacterium]
MRFHVSMFIAAVCMVNMADAAAAAKNAVIISPEGSDVADGRTLPFKTLERARNEVRTMLRSETGTGDIIVYLRGGTYRCEKTVVFGPGDGSPVRTVAYAAYPGERPVFDGGIQVTGWKPWKDGIYRAHVPLIENTRQFYINGVRMRRAHSGPLQLFGMSEDRDAFVVRSADIRAVGHPEDLLVRQNVNWRTYMIPVDGISAAGEWSYLKIRKPFLYYYLYKFNFEMNLKGYMFLDNAPEFIDAPGSWYFDRRENYLYCKPPRDVPLNTAVCIVPSAETFIRFEGGSDGPVCNIRFDGITFQYDTWTQPDMEGCAPTQTTVMVGAGGSESYILPAMVSGSGVSNIVIENCTFIHSGKSAVNFSSNVSGIIIRGNVFCDIAAAAVNIGTTKKDAGSAAKRVVIANNVLRETGKEYHGSAAISVLYSEDTTIAHNDIRGADYTAVSVGWGWSSKNTLSQRTIVEANRIFDFNRKCVDGAAIYSLSRSIGSGYRSNYVGNAFTSFNTAALYHDEGSAGYHDIGNVIELCRGDHAVFNLNGNSDILIENTYTTTGNAVNYKPQNVVISNVVICPDRVWPEDARAVIAASGLEPEYRHLLDALPPLPAEPQPVIRTSGLKHPAALMFEPGTPAVDRSVYQTPFLEENGSVIIDARDYAEYTGLERCAFSFVGVHGWFDGFASKHVLMANKPVYERGTAFTELPTLSYRIKVITPGTYRICLRGKGDSDKEAHALVSFAGRDIGPVTCRKEFAWITAASGKPLDVSVPEAGVYDLKITGRITGWFFDRILFTRENAPADGSTEPGPVSSPRDGVPFIIVPPLVTGVTPPVRENIALKKPVTVSSMYNTSFKADNVTDGKFNSEWVPGGGDKLGSATIDLGAEMPVSEIQICFRVSWDNEAIRRNIAVRGSNDPDMKDAVILGSIGRDAAPFGELWKVLLPDGKPFRFISVSKTDGNGGNFGLGEVRVYAER